MALFIYQPGVQPLGDFDVLDTDQSSVEGGYIMTLDEAVRSVSSTEKAAYDVLDGYIDDQIDVGTSAARRVIARIADDNSETYDLFYLADDGNEAEYGTLFGEVIGSPAGLSTTGTRLGPHTSTGSGKVTLWDKPGLYGVTLDSCATDVVPTSSGNLYDTPLPGTILYRSTSGTLTRETGTSDKIGAFVELANDGSLVTTPNKLVGATESWDRIKLSYFGAHHNA